VEGVADQEQPEPITDDERLGRQGWSGKQAKKILRRLKCGKPADVPVSAFEPKTGCNDISADRMDLASQDELAELAEKNTTRANQTFRGWYTLTARDVTEAGCRANPTLSCKNPYHADIVFPVPLDADDRKNKIRNYAWKLALRAQYEPWGDWQNEVIVDPSARSGFDGPR